MKQCVALWADGLGWDPPSFVGGRLCMSPDIELGERIGLDFSLATSARAFAEKTNTAVCSSPGDPSLCHQLEQSPCPSMGQERLVSDDILRVGLPR